MVLALFVFSRAFYSARDLITLYSVYLCLYITLSDVFLRLGSEEIVCKRMIDVTHDDISIIYFCIVLYATFNDCNSFHCDVRELIRASLFSTSYEFKKKTFLACLKENISGSIYPFEEGYISFESSRHAELLKNW